MAFTGDTVWSTPDQENQPKFTFSRAVITGTSGSFVTAEAVEGTGPDEARNTLTVFEAPADVMEGNDQPDPASESSGNGIDL